MKSKTVKPYKESDRMINPPKNYKKKQENLPNQHKVREYFKKKGI